MNQNSDTLTRCSWCENNELMKRYHDTEWGVPLFDDYKIFEFLVLETFQAGLSWMIVLRKREHFRAAFDNFNFNLIAKYDDKKIEELLQNDLIIRNRLKISAMANNARAYIRVREEFGSFSKYIWAFVGEKPVLNAFNHSAEIPVSTTLSDILSADLKERGFKFCGSTVMYAHMRATGIVNDHLMSCFRYNQV